MKDMNYYDVKKLVAGSFGTDKAKRKLASVMTNRVDDEGDLEKALKSKRAKGTFDSRLHDAAEAVVEQHAKVKKEASQSAAKRRQLYSEEALLPESIVGKLPFKLTHEALQAHQSNPDQLKGLLCSFACIIAKKTYQFKWQSFGSDKLKKRHCLQSIVYLDALIQLYRMPPAFEFSMSDLSQRFKNIPEEPLLAILEKFCKITIADRHGDDYRRGASKIAAALSPVGEGDGGHSFKFLKSKEAVKQLTLHIIGIVVHLSTQRVSKGYFLERILKKNIGDLKSYFTELGLHVEPCKRQDKDGGKKIDDVLVSFKRTAIDTKSGKTEVAKTTGEPTQAEAAQAEDEEEEKQEE